MLVAKMGLRQSFLLLSSPPVLMSEIIQIQTTAKTFHCPPHSSYVYTNSAVSMDGCGNRFFPCKSISEVLPSTSTDSSCINTSASNQEEHSKWSHHHTRFKYYHCYTALLKWNHRFNPPEYNRYMNRKGVFKLTTTALTMKEFSFSVKYESVQACMSSGSLRLLA